MAGDVGGAKHREAAGQRQHAVRQRVALHRKASLRKAHVEPRLHPPRAAHQHMLVGGQRMQFRVEREQRIAFADRAGVQHEVAVHEDDEVVLAQAGARHGAEDERDGDALAGLVLADDAQRDVEIAADQPQMPRDLVLVRALRRAEPDRRRHAGVTDLAAQRADHRFRDFAVLAEGRHLDVDVARPPARVPHLGGAVAHARIGDIGEDQRPHPVIEPPQIAPDAEQTDDVDEFLRLRVPDRIGRQRQRNETDREIGPDLQLDGRRPLFAERQRHGGVIEAGPVGDHGHPHPVTATTTATS